MRTFYIATTQKSPSMIKDIVEISATDYADAVRQTQESWTNTKRTTSLHMTKYVYADRAWHYIDYLGNATDRNFNSGVIEYQNIA